MSVKRAQFQFYNRKRALEMDGSAGCTTVCMYLMSPHCVLKNGQDGKLYDMCTLCHAYVNFIMYKLKLGGKCTLNGSCLKLL